MTNLKSAFKKDNPITQNKIYKDYIFKRNEQEEKMCYCGHTTDCDCSNPSFEEFKYNVLNGNIDEEDVDIRP
jgi:hypothetical protein